jgi:hypothetical protein
VRHWELWTVAVVVFLAVAAPALGVLEWPLGLALGGAWLGAAAERGGGSR